MPLELPILRRLFGMATEFGATKADEMAERSELGLGRGGVAVGAGRDKIVTGLVILFAFLFLLTQ
jgi:hypothetical protein